MSEKRKRIGLLFGGRSAEHEVSRMSAANILRALDPDRYDVVAIGIGRDGRWVLCDGGNGAGVAIAGAGSGAAGAVTTGVGAGAEAGGAATTGAGA